MKRPSASRRAVFVATILLAIGAACRRGESVRDGGATASAAKAASKATLILAGYTSPREAYRDGVIPAFQANRKLAGHEVEIQESYQGSGAQARAIIGGFQADVAALSLEADLDKIVDAKLITHDWRAKPHRGVVTTSVVVIAVRAGNPEGIRDWADLTRPGVEILTPDPRTSGGAMWNVNALYGAALRGFAGVPRGDKAAAEQFLKGVVRNVTIMDKGARESITTFERGVGDVAITYENEVIVARQAGQAYEYVVPRSTIRIESPVAVVDASVDAHGVRPVAEAFVDFLWTTEAQRAFAARGLRPVDPAVASETASQFPEVEDLFGIEDLGGWKVVLEEVYGPHGVWARVFAARGAAP